MQLGLMGSGFGFSRPGGSGGGGPVSRMSVVATHQAPPNGTNTGNQDIMSRSTFVATDAISVMALVFVNWYNEEAALGAASATVQAGIEYPLGTSLGTFTFSAGATGTIPAGQSITSDTKTLGATIPAGATFAIRTFWHNNDGILFCTAIQDANNDMRYGATGVVSNSVGGVGLLTGGGSGFGGLEYRPALVLGMTAKNVYFIAGDSKCRAFNDQPGSPYGPTGNVQRSIPVTTPNVNLGVDSEQLVNVVGAMTTPGQNYYQRTQWIKTYASKVIMQLGVNDIYNAGRSAAQIAADIATFKTQVNGLPVIPCTIGPNTTSTDSWATLANQTVKAQEGVRLTYNTATRALGAQNFIDVARFIDPTDTAKWPVNGVANKYTSDGLHETFDGYALEQTNGTPQLTWVT